MNKRLITDTELNEWASRISGHIGEQYKKPTFKLELIGPIPVSLQAKFTEKQKVVSFLRSQTTKIPWLFLDDVTINVQWYINDRVRYENDSVPDIDNVLKPILDSISGKNGILVDDCQVINVNIAQLGGWVDGYERFDLEIRALDEYNFNWAWKDKLRFLSVKNGICWPLIDNTHSEYEELKFFLTKYIDNGEISNLPIQRFYHISRLTDWEIIK